MKRIAVMFSRGASALRYLYTNDPNYGVKYKIVCGIVNKNYTEGEKFCTEKNIRIIKADIKSFCESRCYLGKIREMPRRIRKDYFTELYLLMRGINPDLILLSGFMLIMTEPFLGGFPMVNVHPADLRILGADGKPKYRGDDAVTLAIKDGQTKTSSTIHYVEPGEVDCGSIICVSNPILVKKGINPKEHQEKMKILCDGPAYIEALKMVFHY